MVRISITKEPGMDFLAIFCSIVFLSLVGIGHADQFASKSCYGKSGCPNEVAGHHAPEAGISNSGHQYSQHPPTQMRDEESNPVTSNKQGRVYGPHHSYRGNVPSPGTCVPRVYEEKSSAMKTDWRANTKHENMDDGALEKSNQISPNTTGRLGEMGKP